MRHRALRVDDDEPRLTTSGAARLAGRSESCMRAAADRGELPVERTASGFRLYRPSDVRGWVEQHGRAVPGAGNEAR